MRIKDRIKEFRRVPANELLPNPKNWRTHGIDQTNALKGILADVGFADAVLCRETAEGLQLIDGHLRVETMGDQAIPVLVLDVSESEAALLLATIDPLAALATADKDRLDELLAEVATNSEALQTMLSDLAKNNGLYLDAGKEFDESCANDVQMLTCPYCGKEFPQ